VVVVVVVVVVSQGLHSVASHVMVALTPLLTKWVQ
jgi:hypothetical protein